MGFFNEKYISVFISFALINKCFIKGWETLTVILNEELILLENVCSRWRLKMEWFARPGGPHRLTIVDGGAAGGRTQNYKNKRFFILYSFLFI